MACHMPMHVPLLRDTSLKLGVLALDLWEGEHLKEKDQIKAFFQILVVKYLGFQVRFL